MKKKSWTYRFIRAIWLAIVIVAKCVVKGQPLPKMKRRTLYMTFSQRLDFMNKLKAKGIEIEQN